MAETATRKIERLEPSQHVAQRWLVFFEDGELLRVGEGEVAAFGLYKGMEVSGELYADLTQAARLGAAKAKALEYLSHRPLSRKELIDKLTARPYDKKKEAAATPAQAEEIAHWLEELGYLNDAEYARSVVRHYSAKGWGERKVRDELWKRGVAKDLWDQAMEEAQEPEDGIDAFLQKRFKGQQPDQKELKRASDALARRGYRWNEIREGLNRYGAGIEEE